MSAQMRRVKLPESNRLFRAGKIRLGQAVETGKSTSWGAAITRPVKLDHFRVDPEDGVTNPAAAAAFHDVYGDEPKSIRVMLPGETIDDVLSGAWRLYGANKLKRICDRRVDAIAGEIDPEALCDERTKTGGWDRGKPCVCNTLPATVKNKKGEDVPNPARCALRYTLQVVLPDLPLYGAWQVDTGSVISIGNLMSVLPMLQALRGTLLWAELELALVPVTVQPEGHAQTTTVYVLEPRIADTETAEVRPGTLRHLMANQQRLIGSAGAAPQLPAPAIDEEPDDLLDHPNLNGALEAESPTPADRLAEEFDDLDDDRRARFAEWCASKGIKKFAEAEEDIGDQTLVEFLDSLTATPPAVDPGGTGAGEATPAATTTPPQPVVDPEAPAADAQPAAGERVPSYSKANPTIDDVKAWMAGLSPGKTLALAAVCSNMGIRPLPVEILDKFGPDDVGDVFAALEEPAAPAAADPAAARSFINGIHDQVGLPSPDQGTLA